MCHDDVENSTNPHIPALVEVDETTTSNIANETDSVKVLENLRIKIGEAKHLIPGNRETRNSYCSVCLDQEEIFKTRIIEKSLSPFFQEDVDFDIPHKFRLLCFNLHDVQEDVLVKRDHIYAKVVIKKTDIMKYNAHEHWFPLMPVESYSKVQGQVFVDLKFSHYQSLGLNVEDGHKLSIKIPECSGLLISGGNCDPYVTVSLQGTHRNETKKTRVRKTTTNPHFDEEFVFELNKNNNLRRSWFDLTLGGNEMKVADQEHWTALSLKVAVYSSGTLGDEFLGEVKIPLSSFIDMKCHAGWYLLNARSGKTTGNGVKEDFGSIRLKIAYIKDHVFPSRVYNELLQLLVSSVNVEPISASWPSLMSTVCGVRNRSQVVRSLVRIFLQQGMLSQLIEPLADEEVARCQSPSTLFRNTSLVSGVIEETMRLVGLNYLFNVLAPSIEKIRTEKKSCEIDSSRLANPSITMASSTSSIDMNSQATDQSQINMNNLWEYVYEVVTSILKSSSQCPSLFCEIFNGLRNSATKHLPDDANTRYSVVASFIFLRFFAAALLSPKKYKLINEDLDVISTRTCTLVAKIVQHLCNKSMPKPCSTQTTASYVNIFCKRFVKQEHLDSIQNFIDIISSTMKCLDSKGRTSSILEKVMLKEGEMVKRAQGRTFLLSRKNFKRRYFALTNYELSYRKNKSSKPLCIIPVQEIRGVEKLQEESFRMAYMFQVIQPSRVLYCKANNSVEQKEWMDVLSKICTCNRNRAQHYHPGAFLQGKYCCCNATTQKAPGCTRVTGLPASIRLNTDLDRELERVYSLLCNSVDRIYQLQEECGARAVYVGPQLPSSSQFDSEESVSVEDTDNEHLPSQVPNNFDVEDPQHTFRTLCSMLECVNKLKKLHEKYFAESGINDAELGTHERPYGDT